MLALTMKCVCDVISVEDSLTKKPVVPDSPKVEPDSPKIEKNLLKAESDTSTMDFSMMTVAELRKVLRDKGLDTAGRKTELIKRLEEGEVRGDIDLPPVPSPSPPAKKQKVEPTLMSSAVDYLSMTHANLRKKLKSQGLDTSGKKTDLIDRLQGGIGKCMTKEEPMEEEVIEEIDFSKAKQALASAGASDQTKKMAKMPRKVDPHFDGVGDVVEDWDCMLNQTNIDHNNNKFYIIQLLKDKTG